MPRQPPIKAARQMAYVQISRMTLAGRAPLRFPRSPRCRTQVRVVQPITPRLPRATQPTPPPSPRKSHASPLLSRALEHVPLQRRPRAEPRSVASRRPLWEEVREEKGPKKAEEQSQEDLAAGLVSLILVDLCLWEVSSCLSEVSYNLSGRWRLAMV